MTTPTIMLRLGMFHNTHNQWRELAGDAATEPVRVGKELVSVETNFSWGDMAGESLHPYLLQKLTDASIDLITLTLSNRKHAEAVFQSWLNLLGQIESLKSTPRVLWLLDPAPSMVYVTGQFYKVWQGEWPRHTFYDELYALLTMLFRRPSVFLSHSWHDKKFVRKLGSDLSAAGVRVWLDEAELNVGDSLIERLRSAIDSVDYLIVVLSESSIQSPWVQREVDIAMNQEINSKKLKVLPVVIQDCPLPGFLLGKVFADFRPRGSYRKTLHRLQDRILGIQNQEIETGQHNK